jgi:hypothetical protein
MISATVTPRELEVDRQADLTVYLTNTGSAACTNLVFRLTLPPSLVPVHSPNRVDVAQLEPGDSAVCTTRVRPRAVGVWTLTSPNFSYQDSRGYSHRIRDLRLDVTVVPLRPPGSALGPPAPESRPRPGRHGIFICYRREDSEWPATRIVGTLRERFGRRRVFIDVDSIEPGVNFVEAIHAAIESCAVLLAFIGPDWLHATDRHGRRRLDDPDDYVRLEIEAALTRRLLVIPILVGETSMPNPEDLPGRLAEFAYRNAVSVTTTGFDQDIAELVKVIGRLVPPAAP